MFFCVFTAILFFLTNVEWRPYISGIIACAMSFNGFYNGYITSRYLKFFGKTDLWFSTTLSAAVLPLYIVAALTIERFAMWSGNGITRHGFMHTIFKSVAWYSLHAVMCYLGAFKGYTELATKPATPIGRVIRPIPKQPCYQNVYILAPVCGLIQFVAIHYEL